jgi:predicted phosphodiesterase
MVDNTDWQKQAIALDNVRTSWRSIASMVQRPKSTVSDFLRQYNSERAAARAEEMYPETNPPARVVKVHDNSRILFISDMHIPYHHPGLLPFLAGLKLRYNPTRIICLGDELDKHAMSFHDSDPDLMSAGDELRASLPVIAELYAMFPEMDIIDSNHGSMVYRKAKANGMPRRYIRSYNEVLGVGDGWVWHNDLTIILPETDTMPEQKVYIHHGKSADAVKTSQAMSMSHVCGHFHESFGVKYWANPNGLFFAVNGGCLIDDRSYAFAYNNMNLKRPIIGTPLLIDGVPVLEAMPL